MCAQMCVACTTGMNGSGNTTQLQAGENKFFAQMCVVCATGVNGSGKTTQLQAILGKVQPDSGEIVKAKRNMRIAYLAQVSG